MFQTETSNKLTTEFDNIYDSTWDKLMIIYRLISPSNKSYIGQTVGSVESRFKGHIYAWNKFIRDIDDCLITTPRNCPILYRAFSKYPPENWTYEVLFESDNQSSIDQKEIFYIKEFDTMNNGYNVLPGGYSGRAGTKSNELHKRNIGKSRRKYFQSEKGKLWKQQLSESLIGNDFGKYKAQNWIVTNDKNISFSVLNLKTWCKENDLPYWALIKSSILNNGYNYKGFSARKCEKKKEPIGSF